MIILVILLSAGILGLNVVASLRSSKDPWSLRHERITRLVLIWGIPVAGALTVLFMLRDVYEVSSGRHSTNAELGAESLDGCGLPNDQGYISSSSEDFHSSSVTGDGGFD